MSIISVKNLTFSYETNYENIFENTSFDIDTDWKLVFTGRNGRGKTTFLNLLMGKYNYSGSISTSTKFDYFPFEISGNDSTLETARNIIAPFTQWEKEMERLIAAGTDSDLERYGEILDLYSENDGYIINEMIEKELSMLDVDRAALSRPFSTLSSGEKTKVMLASLFLKKNNFLLIDEPTNHLDLEGRNTVSEYLNSKKGFILVSHDRHFLDSVVDHILSINKSTIDIQKGNFSTWLANKDLRDNFEISENEKLEKEIRNLEESSRRAAGWSDKTEKSKFGEPVPDRGFIGHKAAKMMKRAKSIERRKEKSIESKKLLLKNIERNDELKIMPLKYRKSTLINVEGLSLSYEGRKIFDNISFQVNQGDRIALRGKNGSGKSSILKILTGENLNYSGTIALGSGLVVSYVPQDTGFLQGSLKNYCMDENIDESIFRMLLDKLDAGNVIFEKNLEQLSEGQKKKVLIARSLSQRAHIYIWDEPLNFIDVLSRMQIEELILNYKPTMIFVEHDFMFNENVANKIVKLS
jgi:lincosamide and streptogramin A transport system ATP-binding/permease protein